jgi:Na+-transporting NADH:ubiquinone oxidoreductase subunit NqrB
MFCIHEALSLLHRLLAYMLTNLQKFGEKSSHSLSLLSVFITFTYCAQVRRVLSVFVFAAAFELIGACRNINANHIIQWRWRTEAMMLVTLLLCTVKVDIT